MDADTATPKQRHPQDGQWNYLDEDSVPTSAVSTAPTSPDLQQASHRLSRFQSDQQNGAATHSQAANGHAHGKAHHRQHRSASSRPLKGILTMSLRGIHARLDGQLKAQAESDNIAGQFARRLLDAGAWAEHQLESEWESRRDAISGLDNLWILLSSTASNFNPVCTATYTFETPLCFEDAERVVQKQVAAFPRYRQRLEDVGRRWHGARFVDDEDFKVSTHIKEQKLPEPAGPRELEAFTGEFIAKEWDYSRPLWDGVVLTNYHDPDTGGKGAMVIRGHHTLADGVGFVMSQLYLTSYGPEMTRQLKEGAQTLKQARRGTAKPSKLHKALKPLDKYHHQAWLQVIMFVLYWQLFLGQTLLEVYGSIYQAWITSVIYLLTFWRQRYATAWVPGKVERKEFSASKAFPISDIKKLQRAFSGPKPGSWADWLAGERIRKSKSKWGHLTLNDILCTIISDVIADELDQRGRGPGFFNSLLRVSDRILPNPIGLFIPINIRPLSDMSMRNWATGTIAYLNVPKGSPTSVLALYERLHANKKRLSVVKQSLLPRLFFHVISLTGQAPIMFPSSHWTPVKKVVQFVNEVMLSSFTAVVTNVPGPTGEKIDIEGHRVHRWTALPPQAGKSTLGIGIITYGGTCAISISADCTPGTEGVARRITAKFERRWQQYLDTADEILGETK